MPIAQQFVPALGRVLIGPALEDYLKAVPARHTTPVRRQLPVLRAECASLGNRRVNQVCGATLHDCNYDGKICARHGQCADARSHQTCQYHSDMRSQP